MTDSIIRKVKHFGCRGGLASAFNFSDRSGILFEWNDDVDKFLEDLIEDDLVQYPEVAAKIPAVILDQHQPIPTVEDEVVLQGQAEDEAARNANLDPFNITGMDHTAIIPANIDKIAQIADDLTNADGIIAIADMPNQQTHHNNTIILNEESNEDDAADDQGNDYDDEISNHKDYEPSDDDGNSPADEGDNNKEEDDTKELGKGQNLCCSCCKTKGKTSQFDDYNLFLVARQVARG
jgi:hypothetical protein